MRITYSAAVEGAPKQRRRRNGVRNRGTRDKPRWYCRFTDVDGVRKEAPTHQATRAEAELFLAAVKARIANGKVGIEEKTDEDRARSRITVADLVARFLGDVEDVPGYAPPRLKDVTEYRRQARSLFNARVLPAFGKCAAASIRRIDVERWRDGLTADEYSAASVEKTLTALHKLYAWAKRAELIVCENPVAGVERPRVTSTLDYPRADEVGRLLEAAERAALTDGATHEARVRWPMVATAIYCGLRKGELFGARWHDLAFDAPRLDVTHSYGLLPKGGKPRYIPINPELLPILRWWRGRCPETPERLMFPVDDGRGGFCMGGRDDTLDLIALLDAAAVHRPADGKAWHYLRHGFASHFAMSGGSLYTLQKLLGHAQLEMVQVYAHLSPSFMAEEIGRLSFPRPANAGVIDLAKARAGGGGGGREGEHEA